MLEVSLPSWQKQIVEISQLFMKILLFHHIIILYEALLTPLFPLSSRWWIIYKEYGSTSSPCIAVAEPHGPGAEERVGETGGRHFTKERASQEKTLLPPKVIAALWGSPGIFMTKVKNTHTAALGSLSLCSIFRSAAASLEEELFARYYVEW